MSVRVGFLRAVNLGKRRVPMSRLVSVCEDLGFADVWTWVNSGNVVFDTTGSRVSVEGALELALEDEFGFECTTFVRTVAEVRSALDARPFPVEAGDTHFVTFLKKAPERPRRSSSRPSRTTSRPSSSTAPTCTGGCAGSPPTPGSRSGTGRRSSGR
ncbi:DUF1697 domain-containing protein [Phycicoccus sp. HDW14]|uniref:DUF1697 domain-containing protein n=1 Tax=Phycicoccus sp. HDW14 TaxID=2714941 RepID=UPI00140D6712|nr:DUF1697 domain-containing protein [Phycicoccus sp. HDW14]QIM21670.1 DUF1697 domain-containing protein [Phycicoccus sp. HDW14]